MKILVRYLLVLGAMLGLFWQGVAYASPPCAEMQHEQSATSTPMAGMADCMEAMKQSPDNAPPCKDMKAGCFAMVGCASLAALAVVSVVVAPALDDAFSYPWTINPVLTGRKIAPIPDPPSILG